MAANVTGTLLLTQAVPAGDGRRRGDRERDLWRGRLRDLEGIWRLQARARRGPRPPRRGRAVDAA